MLPTVSTNISNLTELEDQSSKTFKLHNNDKETIRGYIDELEAMKQAIYLILSIERYENLIYSWNYGVELNDLYGKSIAYVIPELERRIKEALIQDDRIESVYDFDFSHDGGKVHVTFSVKTIFGIIETEKEVSI